MHSFESLPASLRDPAARFVHRFRIAWSGTEITGAAAWFDWPGVQEKPIRACLFEVPARIASDISVFDPLLSAALNDWVPFMLSHDAHFRPSFSVARYRYEKTTSDAGTLIFDYGTLSTLRPDPGICAHLPYHEKIKLTAHPDILMVR